MSSNKTDNAYNQQEKCTLLDIANSYILNGLESGHSLPIELSLYSTKLQALRATFVTLKNHEELRGCIGNLVATEALIKNVAHNAYAAAFKDPRFKPVMRSDLSTMTVSISILSPAEAVSFTSEKDLLSKIRPGIDGLILQEGAYRGTFLPSVWESLPDEKMFLANLKQKANLPVDYWSDTIKIERYTTIVIE